MFYLVNRFDQGVRTATTDLSGLILNGFEVIEVPTNVSIDDSVDPFDKSELLDQKFQGVLLNEPYDHVVYDDFADASGIDTTATDTRVAGFSGGFCELPASDSTGDGLVQTSVIDASSDGTFDEATVYWDVFEETRSWDGVRQTRSVTRIDPDTLEAFISNDGGSTFQPILHLEHVQFGAADNQFVIRFENETATDYHLASYALLY